MTPIRAAKAAAAIVLLVIVAVLITNWYGDYKDAKGGGGKRSTETTGSANATGTKPAEPSPADSATPGVKPIGTVAVIIDGLNFRAEPNKDAKLIRGLDKGEKLSLIRTEADWHLVQDAEGVQGWISTNPQYVTVQK